MPLSFSPCDFMGSLKNTLPSDIGEGIGRCFQELLANKIDKRTPLKDRVHAIYEEDEALKKAWRMEKEMGDVEESVTITDSFPEFFVALLNENHQLREDIFLAVCTKNPVLARVMWAILGRTYLGQEEKKLLTYSNICGVGKLLHYALGCTPFEVSETLPKGQKKLPNGTVITREDSSEILKGKLESWIDGLLSERMETILGEYIEGLGKREKMKKQVEAFDESTLERFQAVIEQLYLQGGSGPPLPLGEEGSGEGLGHRGSGAGLGDQRPGLLSEERVPAAP